MAAMLAQAMSHASKTLLLLNKSLGILHESYIEKPCGPFGPLYYTLTLIPNFRV